jgi:hypothetical protein
MTLLDEYQALPAEPKFTTPRREKRLPYTCTTAPCVGCGAPVGGDFGLVPDICMACNAQERARFAERQVERRDAIVRLLCRALHRYAGTCDDVHHNASQRHGPHDPCPVEQDIQALLTAVERDFPENSSG